MKTANLSLINEDTTAILDELFDGVYIIDRDRKIVFWNQGAVSITGYTKDQMIGILCHEGPLKHLDETGCELCEKHCPASEVMDNDKAEMKVVWMHRANSEVIPVETHIKPLKDAAGKVIGAIEVFRNIAHWKHLENLAKEKDRFMGILAHDIRNPLAVVQSYAFFLEHEEDPDIKEIGVVLKRRVKYALTLVNDMLDAQTIDNGEISVNLEEVDVASIVHQAITNFTEDAKAKNIDIDLNIKQADLKLIIDPVRLEEIVNNLISNAINYSNLNSSIELTIDSKGDGVIIKFKDYGVGIKKQDQEKLFKAFGRTSNRPTNGEGSHGLGLYIVKKLIDLFAGSIEVSSEPDSGTEFTVFLPHNGCPIDSYVI